MHAVFKGLWFELVEAEGAPGLSREAVIAAISDKPTVSWPSDAEFRTSVMAGDLYSRKVCKYALRELEIATEGESPSDDFQIEHILPQSPTDPWEQRFADRYAALLNTWANLIPLTGRMNAMAGREPYDVKREEYAGSIFATTRAIAADHVDWTPLELDQRAEAIAEWALGRWPVTRAPRQ